MAKLDIVETVEPGDRVGLSRPVEMERGVHGLAFDKASGIAFLPGEVLVHTLVDSDGEIQIGNIARYLGGSRFGSVLRAPHEAWYRLFIT
ncbi:MAG: hypothetical protein IH805_02470, partial [Proteobacteria bacterium]|nr:hypothetical protein [Pseudomonadota bacterium]